MTDHDNDIDIGTEDDFESDVPQSASLKDAWDNNPLMKIAAVVLGVVVLAGGYITFFGGGEEEQNRSIVGAGSVDNVKVNVGTQQADQEYENAIREVNQQGADEARATGTSAVPIPLSTPDQDGITMPEAPPEVADDPLRQWRQRLDATRVAQPGDELPMMDEMPPVPVAPMNQMQRPQPTAAMDPAVAQRLSEQMRVILTAQMPLTASVMTFTQEPSAYSKKKEEDAANEKMGLNYEGGETADGRDYAINDPGSAKKADKKVIVPAGNIAYGQLLNELDSDVRGPVLVHVLSGPFTGGRALGQFNRQNEYLTLDFNRIVKDGVSYQISGIAMDEKTTLVGLASEVDNHYFQRIILPAAAKFIEGYAGAVAETGTSTTTTAGGGVVQETPEPDATDELYKGLETSASKVSEVLDQNSNRPITVRLKKGTTMGILFLDPVTTDSADK
jgi:intracellular multiplication protein IcmE